MLSVNQFTPKQIKTRIVKKTGKQANVYVKPSTSEGTKNNKRKQKKKNKKLRSREETIKKKLKIQSHKNMEKTQHQTEKQKNKHKQTALHPSQAEMAVHRAHVTLNPEKIAAIRNLYHLLSS